MNCSQCGNPLSPNTKFCKNCGARQEPPDPAPSPEKTCTQCHGACKSDARFCTHCGMTFPGGLAAVAASTSTVAPLPSAQFSPIATPVTNESMEPPLIEPVGAPTTPAPEFLSDLAFQPLNASAPSFPAEPPASSNGWVKWVLLAMVVAAVTAGVLMAGNIKSMVVSGKSPSATSAADKDAISEEDKARADALVGPQTDAVSAVAEPMDSTAPQTSAESLSHMDSSAEANARAVEDVASTATAAHTPVAAPPATAPVTQSAPSTAGRVTAPAPTRVTAPHKNAGPSLDDLLD